MSAFDDEERTVIIDGCKTGGSPGCACPWCATSTPPPAPRLRSSTGPQPSAAYLARIADAALAGRTRR